MASGFPFPSVPWYKTNAAKFAGNVGLGPLPLAATPNCSHKCNCKAGFEPLMDRSKCVQSDDYSGAEVQRCCTEVRRCCDRSSSSATGYPWAGDLAKCSNTSDTGTLPASVLKASNSTGPCIRCEEQRPGLDANIAITSRQNPPNLAVHRLSGGRTAPKLGSESKTRNPRNLSLEFEPCSIGDAYYPKMLSKSFQDLEAGYLSAKNREPEVQIYSKALAAFSDCINESHLQEGYSSGLGKDDNNKIQNDGKVSKRKAGEMETKAVAVEAQSRNVLQGSRIVRISRLAGCKDRHSKVLTSKGIRDRRIRLSVATAIQFYALQDRLGFEQPSKAVDLLIDISKSAIDELPVLDAEMAASASAGNVINLIRSNTSRVEHCIASPTESATAVQIPTSAQSTLAESGPFSQALPGAFHDEAPFSGSFNVSMESKGKNVDVSLNVSGTPRCDEASSSGYSDLPKRSEGQDVDVNLNISGAPRCDEASSSSSSSGPTKSRSDLISSKRKDKVEDVNLDDLWKHIFELRKLREKGNHKKARSLGHFPWPDVPGLQKLKEMVSFGTDLPIEEIHGAVQAILEEIGRVNVATAAPLVVAHALEIFDAITDNSDKCWHLIKEMYELAIVLKRLSESPEGMQDVMQEATSLIIEGAFVCSTQIGRSRLLLAQKFQKALSEIRPKLNAMYMHINTEITVRVFTLIQHQRRSHLSKEYPAYADNGQVEEGLLLTVPQTGQVEEDLLVSEPQKAYIHNNEQVEEDLVFIERQKAYIHNGQVEEDLLVPELHKAYIHNNEQVEEDLVFTKRKKAYIHNGQVEEDLLVPELQKAYIHNNEQVEEDLVFTRRKKACIHNGQVEEDLLAPELQKVYIHNNEQVEEDLVFSKRKKAYIHNGQVEEDLLVPELQKAYIHNNEQVEEDLLSTGRQKVFKMEALVDATNNFHEDNKVGEGGAGAVYKGTTHEAKQIAVKKMSLTSKERRKQFMNEKLLAEVQHRNLVNLLGSCEQESQGFLVYEYLPNKSLDKFLFDPEKRKELDWHICYKIILGTARGLCYLHEDCQVRIVHRDIKASNILLDEKLNPKIADFGTANLFPEDRTHVTATSAVGTFGYIAPEYFMTGKLSLRIDVYSFGIVVLELLTGEKISLESLERVWHSYKKKKFAPTIDPTMTRTEKAKALRCIQVGLLCIQEDLLRPTMSQVITMLSTSENLPVPKKPPLVSSTERSCF